MFKILYLSVIYDWVSGLQMSMKTVEIAITVYFQCIDYYCFLRAIASLVVRGMANRCHPFSGIGRIKWTKHTMPFYFVETFL